ncbi:MAG: hypothetical protein ACR2GP_06255, partial [Burkholderiaceae bacterium]
MRLMMLNRLFASRLSLMCAATVLAACASPPRSSDHADAEALARAETAFAAMSASAGVKAAFLDALADDATLF